MKNSSKVYLPILLFFLPTLWSCEKSTDSTTTPQVDQNLIPNSSFESATGPLIEGWNFRDSTIYDFFPVAPAGGGNYSVLLRPVWHGPFSFNSVMRRVALPVGTHRYRLSCWAKRLPDGAGFLALFVGPGDVDTMTTAMTIPIADTVWTSYSRNTVITNQASGTVVVALHGGYSPVGYPADSTFFDLCRFEKLD